MVFEWDEEKNLLNQRKHGISFEIAAYVFTERKEKIRLISARLATETERRLYYDQDIQY